MNSNRFFSAIGISLLVAAIPEDGAPADAPPASQARNGAMATADAASSPEPFITDAVQAAMRKLSVTPGLKLDLYAREPLIQNPTSFAFDDQGRCFVVETHRRRTSLLGIEMFPEWLDADYALRTPEQRAELYKERVSENNRYFMSRLATATGATVADRNHDGHIDWHDLEVESERIRLLVPGVDGARAQRAVTFAEGFDSIGAGVAAGVLARRGEVYFTCMPDLWKFTDDALRGTRGIPDAALPLNPKHVLPGAQIQSLQTGFGVHIGSSGHDLHGLKLGPDGRIYWTVADRGSAPPGPLKGRGFTPEFLRRTLPDCGAVFRCEQDGANFEIVAVGLRNPMELAFDDAGNLFTVDNDGDQGDKCRVIHVVEGADYGWRYGWQNLPNLGAWNGEMLWGLAASNTSAYSPLPAGHLGHGPAGLTHYPGTGLPDRFANHFFVADFPGGVRYFELKPDGAGFTVDNPAEYLRNNSPEERKGKLLWNLYPTDVDFSPGIGGVFVLDWIRGWEKTGQGRIYRLHDTAVDGDPLIAETGRLLADGIEHSSETELVSLLRHRDQRVRNEAHFRVAEQEGQAARAGRPSGRSPLFAAALAGTNLTARLHALWAIGIVADRRARSGKTNAAPGEGDYAYFAPLVRLLDDATAEVRAQTATLAAACPMPNAVEKLVSLLKDPSARVRFCAAQSLGRLARPESTLPLLDLLRTDAGKDPSIRHAAVVALMSIGDKPALRAAAHDGSASVRLGVLLAMRRLEMPDVGGFLADADPQIVLEAARAIHDGPIESAAPGLARWLAARNASQLPRAGNANSHGTRSTWIQFALRRAVDTCLRLGRREDAEALVGFAKDAGHAEAVRVEALAALGEWSRPGGRDRVTGNWRPRPGHDASIAAEPLRAALDGVLHAAPDSVPIAAIDAAAKLNLTDAAPVLFRLAGDEAAAPAVRGAALRAMAAWKYARLTEALKLGLADSSEAVRTEAGRLLGEGDPGVAVTQIRLSLDRGSIGERQAAFGALTRIKTEDADALLRHALDDLLAGRLRPELALDVLEAATGRASPDLEARLKTYDGRRDPGDDLAAWRETLAGGEAAGGRRVFYENTAAACVRCHKIGGEGGDVGPQLAGLGQRKDRAYILESLVHPNRQIAAGYESVTVALKSERTYAGILKAETESELTIHSPDDGVIVLKKVEIVRRDKGLSAMPEGLDRVLTKRELRDLVEFIATSGVPSDARPR